MSGPLGTLGQHDILSDAGRLRTLLATSRVRVYNNANISIPNATWTTLTFNSERWDTNGMHSTASNTDRLTCIVPGLYPIVGQVAFDGNATGLRMLRILLNGSTQIAAYSQRFNSAWTCFLDISTQYQFSVAQYVILQVYQNSGGALNILYSAETSPEFMMARIG